MAISDFTDMMPHTIQLSEFSGSNDSYGAPVYNSPVSYAARVSYKPTLVKNKEGEEVVARGVAWVGSAIVVNTEDQIELPDGTTPPVLAVDSLADEDGLHHSKVYFG